MPRPAPDEPVVPVTVKLRATGVDYLDAWAALIASGKPDRSDLLRRMIGYAARHMPVRYDPSHDRTPVQELPCETPPTTTTPNPPTGSPPTSGKRRRLG